MTPMEDFAAVVDGVELDVVIKVEDADVISAVIEGFDITAAALISPLEVDKVIEVFRLELEDTVGLTAAGDTTV